MITLRGVPALVVLVLATLAVGLFVGDFWGVGWGVAAAEFFVMQGYLRGKLSR